MSWYGCEHEQKVFQAAQSGELEAPLKDHVSRCTVCAEVMAVTRFLLEDMRPDAMEIRLPEPRRALVESAITLTRLGPGARDPSN